MSRGLISGAIGIALTGVITIVGMQAEAEQTAQGYADALEADGDDSYEERNRDGTMLPLPRLRRDPESHPHRSVTACLCTRYDRGMTYEIPPRPALPEDQPKRPRTLIWAIVAGVAGLIVGSLATLGVTGAVASADKAAAEAEASASASAVAAARDNRLTDAVKKCGKTAGMDLADENHTLTLDVEGKKLGSGGVDYDHYFCILDALKAPKKVISHVEQTTSIDGRQSETWDGITMEWSYHPDRGSDSVITLDG